MFEFILVYYSCLLKLGEFYRLDCVLDAFLVHVNFSRLVRAVEYMEFIQHFFIRVGELMELN